MINTECARPSSIRYQLSREAVVASTRMYSKFLLAVCVGEDQQGADAKSP
jgi:hypothetical protein